jgi:co-chaperonin GroES (HSP10)
MKPIGKNIVIKTVEETIKTSSGLLLSGEDVDQLRYKKGIIVKPGTEVMHLKEGEEIYYDKRQGFTMLIHDEIYTIIQERDVVLAL